MASKARLFYPDKLKTGTISRLSEKQSHYTKNVMRLKAGDKISLFNSQDGEWDIRILDQGKIFTEFKVEKLSRPISKEKNIWLAFSPIKKNSSRLNDSKNYRTWNSKIYSIIM